MGKIFHSKDLRGRASAKYSRIRPVAVRILHLQALTAFYSIVKDQAEAEPGLEGLVYDRLTRL
jgi:hypothetical protein